MSFIIGLLLVSSSSLAADLIVSVQKSGRYLDISFETTQNQSSMCELVAHRVSMDSAVAVAHDARVLNGVLEIDVEPVTGVPCLMAIGKHTGGITFKLGRRYPELKPGLYELWVNTEYYGDLAIKKNSLTLTP